MIWRKMLEIILKNLASTWIDYAESTRGHEGPFSMSIFSRRNYSSSSTVEKLFFSIVCLTEHIWQKYQSKFAMEKN